MGSVEDLLAYQRELRKEEGLLMGLLSKIDEQLHALQVEQLHLLNSMNSSTHTSTTTNLTPMTSEPQITTNDKDLDLTVPFSMQDFEEEDEE